MKKSLPEEQYKTLLEKQYKIAIEARDKLNDNYHKWMSFYYIANGAILVAITTIYGKVAYDNVSALFLSLIGVFTCVTWNLSCRGYYYWSLSWIDIIFNMESKLTANDFDLMPYSVFSKDVVDRYDHRNSILTPANISTPKLTLRFSIFAIVCWSLFFDYELNKQFICLSKTVQLIIAVVVLIMIFCLILIYPLFVKSRAENSHKLMCFRNLRQDENSI